MTTTINAVSGTGVTQTSDGSGIVKLQSNGVTTNALAWVNFNGTSGATAARASYNVSSITRNSTGNYTVTFTNALVDSNYSAVGNHNSPSSGGASVVFAYDSPYYYSTTQLQLTCFNATNPYRADSTQVTVAVFGN